MNMSYLSVGVTACLKQADWCVSVYKLVISHLYSFYGASHQGLLVWERFT